MSKRHIPGEGRHIPVSLPAGTIYFSATVEAELRGSPDRREVTLQEGEVSPTEPSEGRYWYPILPWVVGSHVLNSLYSCRHQGTLVSLN